LVLCTSATTLFVLPLIDGAPSVVIPWSDFHDRPACSVASHSFSNRSLAVVRPCIVFTQSNSSVTLNWLTLRIELSIIIYVSTLIQTHRIPTETFAFDTQLYLFSDNYIFRMLPIRDFHNKIVLHANRTLKFQMLRSNPLLSDFNSVSITLNDWTTCGMI